MADEVKRMLTGNEYGRTMKIKTNAFKLPAALLCALMLSSCYTSHVAYKDGTWSRTVAFGPAATIKADATKVEASTRRSPTAAIAGGAFIGSAVGSFLRSAF
jgi:hypothetical protein